MWTHRRQLTRLPHPWDSPGKNTGVGCIAFSEGCHITFLLCVLNLPLLLSYKDANDWIRASLVAQRLKRLPAMQETWVQSLGQEDPLEKKMATHSSTLAWRIPWTEEPGGLQSRRSQGVRHDWVTSLSLFTFMHWRRKWQPTPVFLPGESQGWRSLVGCRLWGRTESDMTEAT